MDATHEELTARAITEAAIATAKAVADSATAAAIVLAKENLASHTAIAVLQTRMEMLECQQTSLEKTMNDRMDKLDLKFEAIFNKLDRIATGRPTWAVTVIIAGLFSLSVGLIIAVIAHL